MRKETVSSTAIREGIEALRHMTVGQLKQKYREVFGEAILCLDTPTSRAISAAVRPARVASARR